MQSSDESDVVAESKPTWQPDGGDSLWGAGVVAVGLLLVWWLVDWQTSLGLLFLVVAVVSVAVIVASIVTRSIRKGLYNGCRWTLGLLAFW